MNRTKKVIAMFLAFVMMFALAVPAVASVPGTAAGRVTDGVDAIAASQPENVNAVLHYINTYLLADATYNYTTAVLYSGGAQTALTVTPAVNGSQGDPDGVPGHFEGYISLEYNGPAADVHVNIPHTVIPANPYVPTPPPLQYTVETGGTGNVTITGAGTIDYAAAPDIFSVILPTTVGFDFHLDPLGLSAIDEGGVIDFNALDGGWIIPQDDPIAVINNSNRPISLSVAVTGSTTNGGQTGQATATFITAGDNIGAVRTSVQGAAGSPSDVNNVALYIVPASTAVAARDAAYVPATRAFGISTSTTTLTFTLPQATYVYTLEAGEIVGTLTAGTGNGTMFQVGGLVNPNADWSDFTEDTNPSTIGLSAVFSFTNEFTVANQGVAVDGVPFLQNLAGATPVAALPWSVTLGDAELAVLVGEGATTVPTFEVDSNGFIQIPNVIGPIGGVRIAGTWRNPTHADVNLTAANNLWVRIPSGAGPFEVRVYNEAFGVMLEVLAVRT